MTTQATSHFCSAQDVGAVRPVCVSGLQFTGCTLLSTTAVSPGKRLRNRVTAARVGGFCLGVLSRSCSLSTA